jgi:hypothetical protein
MIGGGAYVGAEMLLVRERYQSDTFSCSELDSPLTRPPSQLVVPVPEAGTKMGAAPKRRLGAVLAHSSSAVVSSTAPRFFGI